MSSQVLLYGMRPTLRRVFVVMVATMCSLATAVTVTPSDGVPDWERHGMYGDANRGSPPPPPWYGGTSFAGTISDNAILQRGAIAAVNGVVIGVVSAKTSVTVTVEDAPDKPYTVDAQITAVHPGNVTWKAYLRPHADYGGNVTLTATCSGCNYPNATSVHNLRWGDVWICSGQSNMELGVENALTRNRTIYAVEQLGWYKNIHTLKRGAHIQARDGDERWTLEMPCWLNWYGHSCYQQPWKPANIGVTSYGVFYPNNFDTTFSATCWFFAQTLTDIALEQNRTPPVIGLIETAWGGTEINGWRKNNTISACKNNSGGTGGGNGAPTAYGYGSSGSLWNGMLAPFINTTIFGALWYQGENDLHYCVDSPKGDGGLHACGNVVDNTGYACAMRNMISEWRKAWSVVDGTTSPSFPFGIVTLAGGTSEGCSFNMPNMRLAQTASYGILPGPVGSGMENTFVAQGALTTIASIVTALSITSAHRNNFEHHLGHKRYDAADPTPGENTYLDFPYQTEMDTAFPGRSGFTARGLQYFTPHYMGGLHPRAKQTIGHRLALGAAAIAYKIPDQPYTGPVFQGCTVDGEQITLTFNESLLRGDAVHVWPAMPNEAMAIVTLYNCLNGTCLHKCSSNASCAENCVKSTKACSGAGLRYGWQNNGQSITTLEVQLNNTIWMPASFTSFGTRKPGFATVTAQAPAAIPIGCEVSCDSEDPDCEKCTAAFRVTGVRYAWSDSPCCPGLDMDRATIPCPVNSCPLSTWNSTLPAAPFSASVTWDNKGAGRCVCAPPQTCV